MRISIVTPSFNQAAYLQKHIDSVRSQTYADVEHLIYDPGSTDGSIEMAEQYARSHDKARFVHEPDRGQVDAINKGLAATTGEILTWLNSDDYYVDENVLADVAQYFEAHPETDILYGHGDYIRPDGTLIREAFVHRTGNNYERSLQHSIGVIQPALFFRRRVYERVGGLDESYNLSLDYEYWVRIAQAGFQFTFFDRKIIKAIIHDESKTGGQRMQQYNEILHLVNDRYHYVPIQWIERYAEYYIAGIDRLTDMESGLDAEQQTRKQQVIRAVLELFNTTLTARQVLEDAPDLTPYRETRAAMQQHDIIRPRQIVITSFDQHYFKQGLNLIASLHRTSLDSVDEIVVYGLDLLPVQRERLAMLEKVRVVDYPAETRTFYPEYLQPKSYAYKAAAIYHASETAQPGDLILWMDGGIAAMQDIQQVFDRIRADEFFITDHDDKAYWPFYNITFTHPKAQETMNATVDELLRLHYCSCILGYTRGGRFQPLINEAYGYSQRREAVLWPKHLQSDKWYQPQLTPEEKQLQAELLRSPQRRASVTLDEVRRLFPYYGHTADQPIFSLLAARYNVPVSSAMIFNRSNEDSSRASKDNWFSGGESASLARSRENLENVDESVVIYHHRGIYNNLDGLRYRRKGDALFIIGNGPSLKGFDFHQLTPYASVGMNAAYRYWDEINWYPTYYCCMDAVVIDSHKEEIYRLIQQREKNGIRLFFLREVILERYPDLADNPAVLILEHMEQDIEVLHWPRHPVTTGSFSAFFGWLLGYRDMYLLGIDLNYVEILPEAVKQDGIMLELEDDPKENPNYFFEGYQRKGDRYNIPNPAPNMHIRSWQRMQLRLAGFPLTITNLNPDSQLDIFPFDTFAKVDKRLRDPYRQIQRAVDAAMANHDERAYWRRALVALIQKQQATAPTTSTTSPHGQTSLSLLDRAAGRLKILARYYARWPWIIAVLVIGLNVAATLDTPLAPLFALVSGVLLFGLLGHIATQQQHVRRR